MSAVISRMSSGQIAGSYLSDLRGIYSSLADAQEAITTGKSMLRPSDDPVGIAISLGLRRDSAAVAAWQRNIHDSLTWLGTTDNSLGQALEVVQKAAELAIQGGNGTLSQEARNLIADAVEGLKSQFVEVGNSKFTGQYLFAGLATVGSMLLNLAAKHVYARGRPALWTSIAPETTFSFPSGHAMGSITLAWVVVLLWWHLHDPRWRALRWPVTALAGAFVLAVGLSRIYLGVHYPSDILAGWAAASVWTVGMFGLVFYGHLRPWATRPA